MEYGFIKISENRDRIIEHLLISLGSYKTETNPFSGYQCEVNGSLKKMLSFISLEEDECSFFSERQLFRVYACVEEQVEEVLVVGDSLRGWGKSFLKNNPFREDVLSVRISSSYQEESEWGLIGIAAPGWVLLFEEDLDCAVRDRLNDNIEVGYIPADESFLDSAEPSLTTSALCQALLELILQNLPHKLNKNEFGLD